MSATDILTPIFRRAEDQGINPAIIAREYGHPLSNPTLWWKPQELSEAVDVFATRIDLLAGRDDVLARFVEQIADSVQFPRSTAFLHGLGVLSAAMVESFFYKFNGKDDNTVALYTVGAQPPSTGKSGIDEYLSAPARIAFKDKAFRLKPQRMKLERQIEELEKDMKKAQVSEIEYLAGKLLALQEDLAKYPNYKFAANDPTPEGCERLVARNGGFCNVVSDESSAIKVILGAVYGKGAATSNNGIFLRLWDNGYQSVERATREGFEGHVRGSIALLAQDVAIYTIMQAGQQGEGISERFLMIREKNLLGKREHLTYKPVDATIKAQYEKLIENVVNISWKITLTLSPEAETLVRDIKNSHEPLMADGAKFSSSLLRGVVGKGEKQIIKIACVLHVAENWCEGGKRDTEIKILTIVSALSIFNQLLETYVAAADSTGFSGEQTELAEIIKILAIWAGKNTLTSTSRKLRDAIKNKPQFAGDSLTKKIREDYLPKLEKLAYVVYDTAKDEFFINPLLK